MRELKQHLSAYLDRVSAGEVIRVTDRGRAKAIISPLFDDARLQAGIDEGWIRPAVVVGGLTPVQPVKSRRRVADVFAEDRGS